MNGQEERCRVASYLKLLGEISQRSRALGKTNAFNLAIDLNIEPEHPR
jgi:hypothetical protein